MKTRNDKRTTNLAETLRSEADAAKARKDHRRAAALLACLADINEEPATRNKTTSPTWREAYACNAKA
mgnify:CR=1 FL=1